MDEFQTPIKKLKEESSELKKEIRERTMGYIVAAFGLIAGLAWNEAIKSLIEYFFPLSANTLWAKLGYAILVTLVVVVISVYLVKLLGKNKGKEGKS